MPKTGVRRTLTLLAALSACAGSPPPAPSAPGPAAAASESPGEAPPPAAPPPAAPATPPDVVAQQRAPLDACYKDARAANAALNGTSIEVTFNVGADGRPVTVDLHYKHHLDDKAKECMREAALGIRFPSSMEGIQKVRLRFEP